MKPVASRYRTLLKHAGWCLAGLLLLFASLLLLVRFVLLPDLGQHRERIASMVSAAVGAPVSIGALETAWSGLSPRVILHDVVVRDPQGQPALTLPEVGATVSWKSIPALEVRLARLDLQSPDLSVVRDAQGRLHVGGLLVSAEGGNNRVAEWILTQGEIAIRQGRLRWRDDLRGTPELVLEQVQLGLANATRRHRLSLQATPPADMAAPLDIRADFRHPLFAADMTDMTRWTGTLYTDLYNTDLGVWKTYLDYPVDIASGKGAVRAWLDLDGGQVTHFVADVNLTGVNARLAPQLQPLRLQFVRGRIAARETGSGDLIDGLPAFGRDGHEVSLRNFALETDDGMTLDVADMVETFSPATATQPEHMRIRTSALDLKTVSVLAERLPLTASQRRMIHDMAPSGKIMDFTLQWEGTYPEISAYRLQGRFDKLSLQPLPGVAARVAGGGLPARAAMPAWPGVTNLSGTIDTTDKRGTLSLDAQDTIIVAPEYLSNRTLAFDTLKMTSHWELLGDQQMQVQIDHMDFVQEAASGSLNGSYTLPLDSSSVGRVDVRATIDRADMRRIGDYLPSVTDPDLKHWLANGIRAGTASGVSLVWRGDIEGFPYADGNGEFAMQANFNGMTMDYQPGHFHTDGQHPEWPLLEQASGKITMKGAHLEILADKGITHGVPVGPVSAVIADVLSPNPLLDIRGKAAGELQLLLDYLRWSPVSAWTGHFLDDARATRSAKLDLFLSIPLMNAIQTTVKGSVTLDNNEIHLLSDLPVIEQAHGVVGFTDMGFSLEGIRGRFLGGNVTASGGMSDGRNARVQIGGQASAAGLQAAWGTLSPELSRLIDRVSGQTAYVAHLSASGDGMDLVVNSGLEGMALDLPSPLGKVADDAVPFRLTVRDVKTDDALILQDELDMTLGKRLAVHYAREKHPGADGWRILHGGIGINQPAPRPDSGVVLYVDGPAWNVDAWERFSARVNEKSAGSSGASGMAGYMPDALALTTPELLVHGRQLTNVALGATLHDGVWQANIHADQVSGHVSWTQPGTGNEIGHVRARLAYLDIPREDSQVLADGVDAGVQPQASIPELDIQAEDFRLRGRSLGRLELNAFSEWTNVGQEWRIRKLNLKTADSELRAAGSWIKAGNNSTSNLTYAISIADAGKMLDRLGFKGVVRGGSGTLDGALTWRGSPMLLDLASLSGDLQLDVRKGQFLQADPGAAKLLGVLSLQSLPRRLALDFRDVFSEGFAFDRLQGTARLDRGLAKTNDLHLTGVTADVRMTGEANIISETQDLRVVVVPDINVGAASVVAMTVNPVVGLGSMIAQFFLSQPLKESLTFAYDVTGSWYEPVVNKVIPDKGKK